MAQSDLIEFRDIAEISLKQRKALKSNQINSSSKDNCFSVGQKVVCHIGRVYALTRVGTLLTRVARKRRGLVPEC